ncbi:uncharacterized protein [Euwallacea fornicatus]|uniref:uncharacterized protein n=1 Tax=Euwallacea fornicatus TaxID=995702 RepID=UPI00338D5115
MSPKKQPQILKRLCLKMLSNQLIHALSDEEGTYQEKVRKYVCGAPYDVLQSLLKEILGLTNLDASIRFSCLQVLLKSDLRTLEIGIFPRFYYDQILQTIKHQGKGLQQLNLKGVWARDFPELLSELILSLSQLKSLMVPHMSDDSVIKALLSLKSLVKLDISGEACYTAAGIRQLRSDTIKILDIGSFGKKDLCQDSTNGYELIAEIISNLPNLNVLKTYSFTGHALLYLYKKDNNFRTKLTYLHATDCSLEILEAIHETCPYLGNAHINQPQEEVVKKLSILRNLCSVKLTKGDTSELQIFLQSCGHKLQQLKLNHSKPGQIDLSQLCEYAPGLHAAEFYQMQLTFTNPGAYFVNLQKIQILYCDISDAALRTVLTNSPFLRSFTVGCSIEMTDGDMFRLLSEYSLENLEELLLSEARCLTAITVELLADNCPKLRVLGSLMGWDITQEEIDALRLLIALSNTDLTLWPVTY